MSGRRELKTFPLNPTLLGKLTRAGFTSLGDLSTITASELMSSDADITATEASDVLEVVYGDANAAVRRPFVPAAKSALDLLREEQELGSIVTFSEQLDNMLGGGVPLCKITEFCGAPGVGKTQMCMQLAVDTHIPECVGGLEGEVVYIDTEGGFIVDRMVDIVTATVQHCHYMAQQAGKASEDSPLMSSFTVETVLAGTHYFRCLDHIELIATVHLLYKFLEKHRKVKLVIVDSVARPFRHNFDDMSVRTRLLSTLAQNLIKIAVQFQVAVVLTNQMTTKIMPGEGNSHLIPALGESWGHTSAIRVVLYQEDHQRRALLYKCVNKKETSCSFQITAGGVRDVKDSSLPPSETTVRTDSNIQQNFTCIENSSATSPSAATVSTVTLDDANCPSTSGMKSHPPTKRQRVT